MSGLFPRVKIWNSSETLTSDDLNAEFDNILANVDAEHAEGYSQNLSQMQSTEDPGDLGSEILTQPISTADEIERLRYTINRIVGKEQWYQPPSINLEQTAEILSQVSSTQPSRVVGGRVTTIGVQPNYLRADGSLGVYVNNGPITFKYYVDSEFYELTANSTLSGLNAAPNSNNLTYLTETLGGDQNSRGVTSLRIGDIPVSFTGTGLNDLTISGTNTFVGAITYTITINTAAGTDTFDWTDSDGGSATNVSMTGAPQLLSNGNSIDFAATTGHTVADVWTFTVGQIGSQISTRVGLLSAFKINNGTDDEYFIGTYDSSGYILGIPRGFLYDSTGVNNLAVDLTFGHTITLLNLTYVFINSSAVLTVTYNPPVYSPTAPSTPAAGDYWYDTVNQTWKVFSAGSFVLSNSVFVGICMQDAAGDTVASRSADFAIYLSDENTVLVDSVSASQVTLSYVPLGSGVSSYGASARSLFQKPVINMPGDLLPGESEVASTTYYIYALNTGKFYFSQVKPIYRPDLLGYYHPAEALRLVGSVFNNASNTFDSGSLSSDASTAETFTVDFVLNGDVLSWVNSVSLPQDEIDCLGNVPYDCTIKNIVFKMRCSSSAAAYLEFDIKQHVYSSDIFQAGVSAFTTRPRLGFDDATSELRGIDCNGLYSAIDGGVLGILAGLQLNKGDGLSFSLTGESVASATLIQDLRVSAILQRR